MTIDRDQKSGLFIISYNVNKPGQAGGLNLRLTRPCTPRRATSPAAPPSLTPRCSRWCSNIRSRAL